MIKSAAVARVDCNEQSDEQKQSAVIVLLATRYASCGRRFAPPLPPPHLHDVLAQARGKPNILRESGQIELGVEYRVGHVTLSLLPDPVSLLEHLIEEEACLIASVVT